MIRLSGCLHTSRIIANYVKDSVKSIYLMKEVFMVFVLNGALCLPSKEIEGVSHCGGSQFFTIRFSLFT